MEISQLEFIIAWVSILGTTLGAIFAAFGFLHRGMREGFKRQDAEIKELRADVGDLKVSVARIEGHLGIGFPTDDEQRQPSERPDCAA
ncbi:MAG: hypothetical protein OXH28_01550 [bacterium]|nr:hypothetical protein [bacterium]MXV90195.1 hypothetical protein [Acidimicrobiia bacterium]MYC45044.1 hypothetical protein [Acidimicrobiia bacterium]MYI18858.1 hypothetical protein [Acidimicrobiia bacterium]